MPKVCEGIKRCGRWIFEIDGGTDKISESRCNVILHIPSPLFTEYLKLRRIFQTLPPIKSEIRCEASVKRLPSNVAPVLSHRAVIKNISS